MLSPFTKRVIVIEEITIRIRPVILIASLNGDIDLV